MAITSEQYTIHSSEPDTMPRRWFSNPHALHTPTTPTKPQHAMTSPLFDAPTPPSPFTEQAKARAIRTGTAAPLPYPPAPEAPALDLDLSQIPDAKLEIMPRANGIARFQPLSTRLAGAEAQVDALEPKPDDTDETIALKSAAARRLRLDLFRATRIEAKKLHGELKEGVLKITRELDGAEREIRQYCEKQEEELECIEQYAERKEQERRCALRAERAAQINPFLTAAPSVDLAEMSEEEFASALADARELHELRVARALAAEEARVKAEQDAEERRKAEERKREEERIRLQQEAEAARAKLEEERKAAAAERARLEAERQAEREAAAAEQKKKDEAAAAERARLAEEARQVAIERERVAELARAAKAKADAEAAAAARQQEQEAEAARRAAAAPDAEKVRALRQRLIDMPLPKMDNTRVFQAADRAVKLAIDELSRIAAKLEGGAA